MKDRITVVQYSPITGKSLVQHYGHGDVALPRSIVAVVEGKLCKERTCHWCDGLRDLCRERRVA